MSEKKRTYEAETLALEGLELRESKESKRDKVSRKRHGERVSEVTNNGSSFPFSREIVLRVIDRIKND